MFGILKEVIKKLRGNKKIKPPNFLHRLKLVARATILTDKRRFKFI
jgi:hypothetical protein